MKSRGMSPDGRSLKQKPQNPFGPMPHETTRIGKLAEKLGKLEDLKNSGPVRFLASLIPAGPWKNKLQDFLSDDRIDQAVDIAEKYLNEHGAVGASPALDGESVHDSLAEVYGSPK